MMRHTRILVLTMAVLALSACKKDPVTPEPVDNTPKDIALDVDAFDVPVEGKALTLTVTAPSRPTVTGLPDWITLKDGTYNNYKITFGLTVVANPAYEERTATLTVTSGSLSKSVSIKQAAAEKPLPPDPVSVDTDLTNPKVSSAAKNVYAFLR